MDSHDLVQRYAIAEILERNIERLTDTGHVHIWSYISQSIVKTFELTDVPVRAGRFIARKNWIVAGGTPGRTQLAARGTDTLFF
jgi:hypothetical protein